MVPVLTPSVTSLGPFPGEGSCKSQSSASERCPRPTARRCGVRPWRRPSWPGTTEPVTDRVGVGPPGGTTNPVPGRGTRTSVSGPAHGDSDGPDSLPTSAAPPNRVCPADVPPPVSTVPPSPGRSRLGRLVGPGTGSGVSGSFRCYTHLCNRSRSSCAPSHPTLYMSDTARRGQRTSLLVVTRGAGSDS